MLTSPPTKFYRKTLRRADANIGPPGLIPHLLLTVSLRSRRVRRLWQSVLLWICTGVLRIPLLRRSLAQFAPHASDMRFCKGRGTMWSSSPTEAYLAMRRGGALPSARRPMAKFSAPFYLHTGLYFPPISPTPPGEHPEKFMRLSDFPRSDIFSSCRENFFVLCSV